MSATCKDCGAVEIATAAWTGGDPQCRHWHREYHPPQDLVAAIENLREIFGRAEIYSAAAAIVGGAL
ncbi:MAG: hypothetical protein MUC33_01200 [Desulfobacterales bacterium]|jgi:hypothetical protein|nr:hypothetical protein [Desulfobacterales bacterium]MCU0601259.1 hypothetical protein [Desulfobacterales bacterium]